MPRQPIRPPFAAPWRQTLVVAACVMALSLAFAAGARAQDDDDDDYDDGDEAVAPLVVDIDGPCLLTIKGQAIPCRGVAYMVFPSSHRIDFAAITDTAGWAFSGEDDESRTGRYALDLDSVLNLGSGRVAAHGRCEMVVGEDRRTVRSLDCSAGVAGSEFTLKASGTITLEDAGNDDGDGPDDSDDDDSVVS
jgi:hypothetical protein